MKEINLSNTKATELIESVLNEVQKRTSVREITCNTIYSELSKIESKLNIPKKYMNGIIAYVDFHAQNFPRAYLKHNHHPESTQFCAQYRNGSWRLMWIERRTVNAPSSHITIVHTPESERAVIEAMSHWY